MHNTSLRILAATAWAIAAVTQATAQGAAPPAKPEMTQSCPGLVASRPPFVEPAALRLAALERDQVRITYVGHSTFLIESPQLVRIATDYNDYVKPAVLPDIATMNHAHSTHYSLSPDPGVKYVLHGWMDAEKPARIDLQYKDVRVRNVPTNIRTFDGGTERHGNSIFVFEVATLCIAHLG
ncbi:MAG: MBL fold metallo-hydrolase, partial [Pseudolabrys sp.]